MHFLIDCPRIKKTILKFTRCDFLEIKQCCARTTLVIIKLRRPIFQNFKFWNSKRLNLWGKNFFFLKSDFYFVVATILLHCDFPWRFSIYLYIFKLTSQFIFLANFAQNYIISSATAIINFLLNFNRKCWMKLANKFFQLYSDVFQLFEITKFWLILKIDPQ